MAKKISLNKSKSKNGKPKRKRKLDIIEPGTINPKMTLPDDTEVDLSRLPGWDEASSIQKKFLAEYCRRNMKKSQTCMALNMSIGKVRDWENSDSNFAELFNMVVQLHVENLEEIEYLSSYTPSNTTSRGRFLRELSPTYNEDKNNTPAPQKIENQQNNQTNIYAFIGGKEAKNKGLAGASEKLKEVKDKVESGEIETDGED